MTPPLVIAAILTFSLVVLAIAVRRAPLGYEDAQGFHEGQPGDEFNDPEHRALMDELARECTCSGDRPCDGLLAGGLCDNLQLHGNLEDYEY